VADQRYLIEVVHAGAPKGAVADRKPGRLDQVGLEPETGGEPQDRAGILGDIGLEQRDPHGACFGACRGAAAAPGSSSIGTSRW
jgi:hypothetical protein